MDDLPDFRYHPDPISTGSIVPKSLTCIVCKQERSHAYAGPAYGLTPVEPQSLCPWCIADGSAAATLDTEFVDPAEVASVEESIRIVVSQQTPSYLSWQQEIWKVHCNDACAFLGPVGHSELKGRPTEAKQAIRDALQDWGQTGHDPETLLTQLRRDGDITGYLFQCLHCDTFLAHVDMS